MCWLMLENRQCNHVHYEKHETRTERHFKRNSDGRQRDLTIALTLMNFLQIVIKAGRGGWQINGPGGIGSGLSFSLQHVPPALNEQRQINLQWLILTENTGRRTNKTSETHICWEVSLTFTLNNNEIKGRYIWTLL